jgi:hypothetical protein
MEEREDRLLGGSIGRTISVYYNDTLDSVSFKTGKFLDFDRQSLLLMEEGNQNATIIPRRKCIRIEIREIAKAEIKN